MPTSALNRKFTEVDQHYADMQELYTMLQARPLKEAIEILRRFRSEDDPESVLYFVKHGDMVALVPESTKW